VKPDSSITPLIQLECIGKSFPGVRALDAISFEIARGELHAICGENGAGKSTLMKILSGVITRYEGDLIMKGEKVAFKSTRDAEAAGISIIHQELNLVEQLSVAANIFMGRELQHRFGFRNDRLMNAQAKELLSSLECTIAPTTLAGSLRVGDQQLIEIAKALSLRSRILIMDEPTSALTESEVARLYRVIEKLRSDGTTILYISHKMDEVFHLSNRITVLRDGQFIKTLETAATSPKEITHLMVGRQLEQADAELEKEAVKSADSLKNRDVVLRVESLSLVWPGHARGYRLKEISFDLHRGEILGIAGLMGAGRTELLESLFGATSIAPTGRIALDGKMIAPRHPSEACRAGLALVTEDRKRLGLLAKMNVGRNITICSLEKAAAGWFLSPSREVTLASSMVTKLQVKTASLRTPITTLSGGNQQKCIVARWLLTNPKVLLLDDPTRGVDVGAKAELYRLIRSLCKEGLSVIVTSSELPELLTLSDRILVLSEGRQTALFQRSEATQPKIMAALT